MLKQNKVAEPIHHTSTVPCKTSEIVCLPSSIMKNINVLSFTFSTQFRIPVKLNCYIPSESASSSCCLVKSIAIIL